MSRVRRPQGMIDDDEYGYGDDVRAAPRRGIDRYDRYEDDDEDVAPRGARRHGGRGRDEDEAQPGFALRLVGLALKHPLPVIGGGASVALVAAIAINALAHQPGHHPAPLFETRPFADATTTTATATAPQPRLKPAQENVSDAPAQTAALGAAQPRMKPVAGEATPLVKDLQALMAARGLYRGDIDGIPGASTTEAIRALEKSLNLVQTGEPNERLLAYARDRGAPGTLALAPQPMTPPPAPAPAPAVAATQPAPGTIAVPVAPPPAPPQARAMPSSKPVEKPVVAQPVAHPVAQPVVQTGQHAVPVTRPAGQRAVPVVPQPGTVATAPQPENRLARVQRALTAAGFGPIRNDGVLDDPTVDAIRRYEVHRGWEPTGRLSDRLTLDLLMKSANR